MNPADIIVLAVIALVVIFALRSIYKTRKSGGCASCPCHSTCHSDACSCHETGESKKIS